MAWSIIAKTANWLAFLLPARPPAGPFRPRRAFRHAAPSGAVEDVPFLSAAAAMLGVRKGPRRHSSQVRCCINSAAIITRWAVPRNRHQTHVDLVASPRMQD